MRFYCGLSKRQKECLKAQKWQKFCSEWHKEFAFFPVRTIDGICVWLETVEYRVHPFRSEGRSGCLDAYVCRLPGSTLGMSDFFIQNGYDIPREYLGE